MNNANVDEVRRQIHINKFFTSAKKGKLFSEKTVKLYKNESAEFEESGLILIPRTQWKKNESVFCKVRWNNAFSEGIPDDVKEYITYKTSSFPKNLNLGQRLYVIASRENNKK